MRYPVTSRIGYFTVLKNTSETQCDISIVTHGPPTPSWWSRQEGLRVKTEETKVKAWSAAATEVPTGSKELGDQIVRLMAALTRAEQEYKLG